MRSASSRPRRAFSLLALFALLLGATGWFFWPIPPLYTVTDIGALPGYDFSSASAINSRGDIIGVSQNSLPSARPWSAFLSRGGAMSRLPPSSHLATSASAVCDGGQATGFVSIASSPGSISSNPIGSVNQAAVFSAGRLRVLETPPGYTGGFGTGINGRGQVVGALLVTGAKATVSPYRAFLSGGGRMTTLGLLPGWPANRANGINAAGLVVGDDLRGFSASRAFLYHSATGWMKALPTPPGMNSRARAVNAGGDVIGTIDGPQTNGHAALWQGDRLKDLGTPPGTEMSIGAALNDRAQAVGTCFNGPETGLSHFLSDLRRRRPGARPASRSTQSAWVYRDGRMSDLNALIPRNSGWTLESASGINDRGQIVGSGQHEGRQRAFLLTPQ